MHYFLHSVWLKIRLPLEIIFCVTVGRYARIVGLGGPEITVRQSHLPDPAMRAMSSTKNTWTLPPLLLELPRAKACNAKFLEAQTVHECLQRDVSHLFCSGLLNDPYRRHGLDMDPWGYTLVPKQH
jgi:hypothetical protein